MCGHVKDSEDKRRGMNYEFDYDTEELINQFSIKSYYYRASEMKIDWNDLAAVMEIKDNYIMGELYQPVKATWFFWQKKPEQVLDDGEITSVSYTQLDGYKRQDKVCGEAHSVHCLHKAEGESVQEGS